MPMKPIHPHDLAHLPAPAQPAYGPRNPAPVVAPPPAGIVHDATGTTGLTQAQLDAIYHQYTGAGVYHPANVLSQAVLGPSMHMAPPAYAPPPLHVQVQAAAGKVQSATLPPQAVNVSSAAGPLYQVWYSTDGAHWYPNGPPVQADVANAGADALRIQGRQAKTLPAGMVP